MVGGIYVVAHLFWALKGQYTGPSQYKLLWTVRAYLRGPHRPGTVRESVIVDASERGYPPYEYERLGFNDTY